LGLVDAIIPEPVGGAHRNVHDTVYNVETFVAKTLAQLRRTGTDALLEARYRKWRSVGQGATVNVPAAVSGATRIASTGRSAAAKRDSSVAKV
jgi:hypothetical protein